MPINLRLPRHQQLCDDLAAQTAQQHRRPGDVILTGAEFVKTHSVAVGAVRKTADVLIVEGLLERFQGHGTFVRCVSFASSLSRLFRFQSESDGRRIPESHILKLDVLDAPSVLAAGLQIEAGAPVIRLAQLRLLGGAPMLAEEIWLSCDHFASLVALGLNVFGDLLYPLHESHCSQIIVNAEEMLTVEVVNTTYARLLCIQPGGPMMVIERAARGYDRVLFE